VGVVPAMEQGVATAPAVAASSGASAAEAVVVPDDDDIVCAVCASGDVENENQIVFCDICDVAVHQACYGILSVPAEQWLCSVCEHHRTVMGGGDTPASIKAIKAATLALKCGACQVAGGALKPMTAPGAAGGKSFAHVICGYWLPGLMFGNAELMQPIIGLDAVDKRRFVSPLLCSVLFVSLACGLH
jgi:NuA3 HAT complex component NTO1